MKFLGQALAIGFLRLALATPARASSLDTDVKLVITGIVVLSAAAAAVVTVLVSQQKNKRRAITGCFSSGPGGMSLMDAKDQQAYLLRGDLVGIKPGDRMTLEGRRRKEAGRKLVFEARTVVQDLGVWLPTKIP